MLEHAVGSVDHRIDESGRRVRFDVLRFAPATLLSGIQHQWVKQCSMKSD